MLRALTYIHRHPCAQLRICACERVSFVSSRYNDYIQAQCMKGCWVTLNSSSYKPRQLQRFKSVTITKSITTHTNTHPCPRTHTYINSHAKYEMASHNTTHEHTHHIQIFTHTYIHTHTISHTYIYTYIHTQTYIPLQASPLQSPYHGA
jgi:hypothetical protein